MGFKSFLKKTVHTVKNIVSFGNVGNSKTAKASLACSTSGMGLGSILAKLLPEDEIGDKFEKKDLEQTAPEVVKEQEIKTDKPETQIKTKKVNSDKNDNKKTVQKPETVKNEVTEDELNKLRVDLRTKCQEANINFAQLMINMAALAGKTLPEFRKLDKNLQRSLLNYIMESIDRVKSANLSDVKSLEAVVTDAALMYHFITHDSNGNEYKLENMSPEEISKRRQMFDAKIKERKEKQMLEIEKLPESERAAAIEQLKAEFAGYRKHIFDELSKKIPVESALELLLIVSTKDVGQAAKELMESYPPEVRKQIASIMHSFDSFKEYINVAKGRGEDLGDKKALEAFELYHKIFGTYKTNEAMAEYEQGLLTARAKNELPLEVLKYASMGIGEAVYANVCMSSEEKTSFIKKWVKDNEGFLSDNDFARVEQTAKTYIKELIEKNPELRKNIAKIENSIKDIVEDTLKREFKPDRNETLAEENKQGDTVSSTQKNVDFAKIKFTKKSKITKLNKNVSGYIREYLKKQTEKFEKIAVIKTQEEITNALLTGIIDEKTALENLNNSEHKFIKLCVQNSTLASIYDKRIDLYIKSEKDTKKLKELASVAPSHIVIKIVNNMRGDKQDVINECIEYNKVDTNTKTLLEKTQLRNAS